MKIILLTTTIIVSLLHSTNIFAAALDLSGQSISSFLNLITI